MALNSLPQPRELKAMVKATGLEPCGTRGLLAENRREFFQQLEHERYQLIVARAFCMHSVSGQP
jgi:hypothetical protein